jgi:hypothetical protein
MVESVKLLCELLRESPLGRKSLCKRAAVSGSSAIKYLKQLSELRMISVEEVHRHFLTRLHRITLTGKLHLLTISEISLDTMGVNRLKLMKDVITEIPNAQNSARLAFARKFLLALFEDGRLDVLQKWANETARQLFWIDSDEVRPDPEPETSLGYSWYSVIPSLSTVELEAYLRTFERIRSTLTKEESEASYYQLRNLYHRNPDTFEEFMEKLHLPELTAWLSR